jgi:hypothetical protein
MKSRLLALAFSFSLVPATVAAQDTAPRATAPTVGPWWIGAWAGGASRSSFDTRHGERYRDFYMAALRVGRVMHATDRVAFDYYADVLPWIRSTNNPVAYRDITLCVAYNICSVTQEMETATARGFAVIPLGLQARVAAGRRLELVIGASFGAAMYNQPVPDPGEKRLNFMGDVTAGARLRVGRSGAIEMGVRQSHTSNANTGRVNPGLDSRLLYVGASRAISRRAKR